MRNAKRGVRGLLTFALLLGMVAEVQAGLARGLLAQRRGTRYIIPPKPANIDSSPTINTLNQALNALGATNLDYGGHRARAIEHVARAIAFLELPTAKGKSKGVIEKALTGKTPAVTKTATTPEAASVESLHKAKRLLFSVHHKLADHTASRGQLRADAQVRLAIDEVVAALKPGADKPADSADFAPKDIPTTGPNRPSK